MVRRRLSRALHASSLCSLSLFCGFSAPFNMILFSSSQPLLSVHRRPPPKMSTESLIESTCLINCWGEPHTSEKLGMVVTYTNNYEKKRTISIFGWYGRFMYTNNSDEKRTNSIFGWYDCSCRKR